MPMPRPRTNSGKKKEAPTSWGMHILTTLLGGAISLALVWGGIQVVMTMMNHMSLNTQFRTANSQIAPYSAQWKLKSSVKYDAGFTCEDKENTCPSLLNEYTTDKPVTVKQLEALVPGKNEIAGDCQLATDTKRLCETTSTSGIFEYHSYVEKAEDGAGYLIVISGHPTKS